MRLKTVTGQLRGLCVAAALLVIPLAAIHPADSSWGSFQDGKSAFDAGRFDVALARWQAAIADRKQHFERAKAAIDTAMALPEASGARNSVYRLIERLGVAEFGERVFMSMRGEAGASPRHQIEVLHSKTQSQAFAAFLEAWLAVAEIKGAAAIDDSLSRLGELAIGLQSYPEAEYWIGRVFFAEGEARLAEIQYKRALDESSSLEVAEQRQEIFSSLSEVYKSRLDWKDYEDSLRASLADAEIFQPRNDFLRTAMERALFLEGFDSMVGLYAVGEARVIEAAGDLGEYLLRNGRAQAVIQLAVSTDAIISEAIAEIRKDEPSYRYSSLAEFSRKVSANTVLASWCADSGLWKRLYYLGEAMLADSRLASGRALLAALGDAGEAGAWGRAAKLALARPAGKGPSPLP